MNNYIEPTYVEAYFQRAEKVEQRRVHEESVRNYHSAKFKPKPRINRCYCNPVNWIIRHEPGFDMYYCDTCGKEI